MYMKNLKDNREAIKNLQETLIISVFFIWRR